MGETKEPEAEEQSKDSQNTKSLKYMYKDVKKLFSDPRQAVSESRCLRRSLLTGISSGMGVGLFYFLFTSRAVRACHYAFGSQLAISTITFFVCIQQHILKDIQKETILKGIQKQMRYEGTKHDINATDRSQTEETLTDSKS